MFLDGLLEEPPRKGRRIRRWSDRKRKLSEDSERRVCHESAAQGSKITKIRVAVDAVTGMGTSTEERLQNVL